MLEQTIAMTRNFLWENKKVLFGLIIVVTLLLVMGASYLGAWLLLAPLLLVLPAVIGARGLTNYPALGLIAMIPGSILVSFSIGTGTETSLHLGIIIVLVLTSVWALDMIARQKRIYLHPSPTFVPLLIMFVAAVISFLNGQLPWFPVEKAPITAQIGGLMIFPISFLAFVLAAHHFNELRWVKWFTWLFLAVAAGFIVIRITPALNFTLAGYYQIGSTASLFWVWLVALAGGQLFFNERLPRYLQAGLAALLAATFYASIGLMLDWASGWAPALATLGVLFLFRWPRLSVLGGLVSLPVIAYGLGEVLAAEEYSYSTRVEAWEIMLEIIAVNPVLGLGPSNYYWYTPLFPIRGYYVSFNSHQQYFDIVAQIGLIGLAAYLWFFFQLGTLTLKLRETAPAGFARGFVYGGIAAIAGTLVSGLFGDWILPFTYNVGYIGMRSSLLGWVFMGILVAFVHSIDWDKEREEEGGATAVSPTVNK
jgi:hypothetical protein